MEELQQCCVARCSTFHLYHLQAICFQHSTKMNCKEIQQNNSHGFLGCSHGYTGLLDICDTHRYKLYFSENLGIYIINKQDIIEVLDTLNECN